MIRFTLLSLLILSSCTQKKKDFNYSSKELNTLLNAASINTIDLDKISPTILTPRSEKDIIGKKSLSNDSFFVGYVGNAIGINKTNYILDISQNKIVRTDKDGVLDSLIGSLGRGPCEFGTLKKIVHNSQYIYIYDEGNSKIHLFDHYWNYLTSHILKNSLGSKTFDVSEKFMFLPQERHKKSLVKVVSAFPPFDEITTLMPQLIPVGKQPFSYNGVAVSSNDDVTAISYTSLPFIFIFDEELKHVRTLHISSKKIESIERPPLEAVAESPGSGIGVPSVFYGFIVLESGDMLSLGKELFYLEAIGGYEYELTSASNLHYLDPVKQEDDGYGITAKYLDQNNDHIIVSSITEDRAYRFFIDELKKN